MRRSWLLIFLLVVTGILVSTTPAAAQMWPAVGGRAVSRDGQWLAPVVNPLLSSDEDDHLARGSVNAWDLSVPLGTPVYPMAAGTVEYAGCNNAGGYGCWALIRHTSGYSSIYAHMLDEGGGKIWVRTGQQVLMWTVLGRVGWTGMTSFGPHVHWEIRNDQFGRQRNDQYFSRAAIPYCKFCPANGEASVTTSSLTGGYYVTRLLFSREALAVLLLVSLALLLFFRPEVAVLAAEASGRFLYKVFHLGRSPAEAWPGWHKRHVLFLAVILVAPALLCGSATAFAIWMSDEGISPHAFVTYWRYGIYPLMGGGYQSGAKYSAVWGMPCSGVGTLGQTCAVDEIVQAGLAWQEEINSLTDAHPVPVVIPRISGRFGFQETRQLLTEMHRQGGLVILDTSHDYEAAHRAIDELSQFGLDGVAIDLEFVKHVREQDLQALADHLAAGRKTAGLKGEGVLVLWNVFHNISKETKLAMEGVRIVPIFTGYGSMASKVAGLQTTQQLFAVQPADSGLMAFDGRWPVNVRCQGFDTRRGFDCQNWLTLFADPVAQQVGWWVQQ
jgi:hypothetical protein